MKRLNKKGFTLVELLAVIVVLAIIMVIATQTIGNIMAQSRADSFASAVKMIRKGVETTCTLEGTVTETLLKQHVEYSDVTLTFATKKVGTETYSTIKVTPASGGKFANPDLGTLAETFPVSGGTTYTRTSATTADVTILASCK